MKEFYIAPEVEIVCFAPVERLATWDGYMNSLFTSRTGGGTDDSKEYITVPTDPVSTDDPEYGGEK